MGCHWYCFFTFLVRLSHSIWWCTKKVFLRSEGLSFSDFTQNLSTRFSTKSIEVCSGQFDWGTLAKLSILVELSLKSEMHKFLRNAGTYAKPESCRYHFLGLSWLSFYVRTHFRNTVFAWLSELSFVLFDIDKY